jgi:hypothetical protein
MGGELDGLFEAGSDPLQAARRESRRVRRFAPGAQCERCGERDTRTLIAAAAPVLCRECRAVGDGRSPIEWHHPAGEHNSEVTIAMPANDHAILSDYQQDWPLETLRNPDGSPLLRAAASVRAWLDVLRLVIERTVGGVPALLETLDAWLRELAGERWWEQFAAWQRARLGAGPSA